MSERFWSILVYSQADMEDSPDAWVEQLDPDDPKEAMAEFAQHKKRGCDSVLFDSQVQTTDGHAA